MIDLNKDNTNQKQKRIQRYPNPNFWPSQMVLKGMGEIGKENKASYPTHEPLKR